jgi:predicted nucleic acid-binding protein
MSRTILLDSGPLGMVSHPKINPRVADWLRNLLTSGAIVLIPEICDYEVRRELLRANKSASIERLDELKETLGYLPITTEAMLLACDFWAEARRGGRPTSKDEALDADVILAGQAATIADDDEKPTIATTNLKHLSRFAKAALWDQIT